MTSYVSILYLLIFLPAVLVYNVLPKKYRPIILLLASYAFFWSISRKLLVFLLVSTVSIHHIGLWLTAVQSERNDVLAKTERSGKKAVKALYIRRQRWIVFFAACVHVGTLLVLKYSGFFGRNINALLQTAGVGLSVPILKLMMPIGISFYTMQAMSYVFDVYRETTKADKNLGRLALYMAFFPTIMEGPICRYADDAEQLWEGRRSTLENLTFGTERILYGVFKKIIIADRLNIMIKTLYTGYADYDGGMMAKLSGYYIYYEKPLPILVSFIWSFRERWTLSSAVLNCLALYCRRISDIHFSQRAFRNSGPVGILPLVHGSEIISSIHCPCQSL